MDRVVMTNPVSDAIHIIIWIALCAVLVIFVTPDRPAIGIIIGNLIMVTFNLISIGNNLGQLGKRKP